MNSITLLPDIFDIPAFRMFFFGSVGGLMLVHVFFLFRIGCLVCALTIASYGAASLNERYAHDANPANDALIVPINYLGVLLIISTFMLPLAYYIRSGCRYRAG